MEGLSIEPPKFVFPFGNGPPIDLAENEVPDAEMEACEDWLKEWYKKKNRKKWHRQTPEEYLERMSSCKTFSGREANPYSGLIQATCWFCHCWREKEGQRCEYCFTQRKIIFHKKIKKAYAKCAPLNYVRMNHDEATKFLLDRTIKKSSYMRFPCEEDGKIIDYIIMRSRDLEGVPNIPILSRDFEADNLDWLVDTPEGYRTSGSLGYTTPLNTVPRIKVATVRIDMNTVSQSMETKAVFEAEKKTFGANPKTIEEVEYAINRKMEAYAECIRRLGGKVFVKYMQKECRLSFIEWKRYTKLNLQEISLQVAGYPRKSDQRDGDEAFGTLVSDPSVLETVH